VSGINQEPKLINTSSNSLDVGIMTFFSEPVQSITFSKIRYPHKFISVGKRQTEIQDRISL